MLVAGGLGVLWSPSQNLMTLFDPPYAAWFLLEWSGTIKSSPLACKKNAGTSHSLAAGSALSSEILNPAYSSTAISIIGNSIWTNSGGTPIIPAILSITEVRLENPLSSTAQLTVPGFSFI